MSETTTASDLLVDRLIEWGVDTVFGLPGDGINGLMDALRKRHIIAILTARRAAATALRLARRRKYVCRPARRLTARTASPSAAPEDSLVIDLFGRRVRIDGQDVDFTYKEFELLSQLARHARRTLSRTELMETVWAEAPEETGERTVDVHVRRVRTKLGRYRRLISTVRGAGYRLDPGSDVAILG